MLYLTGGDERTILLMEEIMHQMFKGIFLSDHFADFPWDFCSFSSSTSLSIHVMAGQPTPPNVPPVIRA